MQGVLIYKYMHMSEVIRVTPFNYNFKEPNVRHIPGSLTYEFISSDVAFG